jgi:glutamate-ammonia-ligase adenylyltransferase
MGTIGEEQVNFALERARTHSPFLRFHLDSDRPVAAAVAAGDFEAALLSAQAEGGCGDPMAGLRRERTGYSLALAIGDLAGAFTLERVFDELSRLADRAIERAIATAIEERTPGEAKRGFAALALGKLGGRELNYSSDVDLIFLFDPATLPRRARDDPAQAAVRIGQRVVELLQKRTEHGFAFRVDLRLRPAPEVTPIALSANAAISHYESSAMPWERAAFIRARHCAGTKRSAAISWKRSTRSCGAAASISAPPRKSRRSPGRSATIMPPARNSAPASTSSAGAAASAKSSFSRRSTS